MYLVVKVGDGFVFSAVSGITFWIEPSIHCDGKRSVMIETANDRKRPVMIETANDGKRPVMIETANLVTLSYIGIETTLVKV